MDDEPKRKRKSEGIKVRVIKVHSTKYAPHFQTFEVVVLEKKKEPKKRDKVSTLKIFGYLPSASPGIIYKVVLNPEKQITQILSWTRLFWWITEDAIKEAFKGYWNYAVLTNLCDRLSRNPVQKEEDLQRFFEHKDFYNCFKNHFFPDLWFDLATLHTDQKNNYSSNTLEKARNDIIKWSSILEEDLVTALLKTELPVYGMDWPIICQILDWAKQRLTTEGLSDLDRKFELKVVSHMEMKQKVGASGGLDHIVLCRPSKAKHSFNKSTKGLEQSFTFVRNLASLAIRFGNPCIIQRNTTDFKPLIEEHKIAYEVEPDIWTLPNYLQDATIINNGLNDFYYDEIKDQPNSFDDALEMKCCLILTKGHNMNEALRKIESKFEDVVFCCATKEAAEEVEKQVENSFVYPTTTPPTSPKVLVFCYSHQYSIPSFARDVSKWLLITRPDKVFIFGDPKLVGNLEPGELLLELVELGKIPVYELGWSNVLSHLDYSPGIQDFIRFLDTCNSDSRVPWSNDVTLCYMEKFRELYDDLFKVQDPSKSEVGPDSYHILSDSYVAVKEAEKLVKGKYFDGFKPQDKVWMEERKQMDWVHQVWPLTANGDLFEEPRNIAMKNRANHSLRLHHNEREDHGRCCGFTTFFGRFYTVNHLLQWATIQCIKDNVFVRKDHVVFLINEKTHPKHLYVAACMARKKLTLVSTEANLSGVIHMASKMKDWTRRNRPSLIRYASDPSKRI